MAISLPDFWPNYLERLASDDREYYTRVDYKLKPSPKDEDTFVSFMKPIILDHYPDPDLYARELAALGDAGAAAYVRALLPTSPNIRLGDFGEIVLAEYLKDVFTCEVPIRRLQNKDHPEMSLRGTDGLGLIFDGPTLLIYKAEAKAAAYLQTATLQDAMNSLQSGRGEAPKHVLYTAMRFLDETACDRIRAHLHNERRAITHHVALAAYQKIVKGLLDAMADAARRENPLHVISLEIPTPQTLTEDIFAGAVSST